jgi:pimeloyl-ACP methyl ester carboxylesterase
VTPGLSLLPGLACDAALFAPQWPALQGLPGLGEPWVSDVHTREATLPAMAQRLLAERPGPQVLVGCSMGGMLALEAWRQAPERVRGIALLGSSARPDTPELIALRSQACELFAQGRVDEVLRANLMFAFHPLSRARAGLVSDYLAMVQRAGADQLIRQNRAVMARVDSRPDLPRLRCPVLVACGEADQLTPPEHSQEIAAALAAAGTPVRLEIVPGAGHLLTLEQPARVNALLADWLRRMVCAAAGG